MRFLKTHISKVCSLAEHHRQWLKLNTLDRLLRRPDRKCGIVPAFTVKEARTSTVTPLAK